MQMVCGAACAARKHDTSQFPSLPAMTQAATRSRASSLSTSLNSYICVGIQMAEK
jgi:hypothetical protein